MAVGSVSRARGLRRDATYGERKLWDELRKLKAKFRRQVPMGGYIVDFAQQSSKLIIEVDGPVHEIFGNEDKAAERTAWLVSHGFRILRFSSKQVAEDTASVMEAVRGACLLPSQSGDGGRA